MLWSSIMSTLTEIDPVAVLPPPPKKGEIASTRILTEPASELGVILSCPPQKVRKVDVHIAARKKGLPNPILSDLGE